MQMMLAQTVSSHCTPNEAFYMQSGRTISMVCITCCNIDMIFKSFQRQNQLNVTGMLYALFLSKEVLYLFLCNAFLFAEQRAKKWKIL